MSVVAVGHRTFWVALRIEVRTFVCLAFSALSLAGITGCGTSAGDAIDSAAAEQLAATTTEVLGESVEKVKISGLRQLKAQIEAETGSPPTEADLMGLEALVYHRFQLFKQMRDARVHEQLALTEQQKEAAVALAKAMEDGASRLKQEVSDLPLLEKPRAMLPMSLPVSKRFEDQLSEVLDDEQWNRAHQLAMHRQPAPIALLRPQLASRLGLDDRQRNKIAYYVSYTRAKAVSSFTNVLKARKLRTEGRKKAESVLNDDQRKRLVEVMGEPL